MTRRYDSSGRKRAAEQTRKRIVDAALRLHWEGITEFEPLAQSPFMELSVAALGPGDIQHPGREVETMDLREASHRQDLADQAGATSRVQDRPGGLRQVAADQGRGVREARPTALARRWRAFAPLHRS